MSTSELRTKLNEYRDYKTMLNELQDAMSAIEDDIKSYMGEQEELNVEGVKVRWTRYQSTRFDSKTFKAEYAAMYEQYTKTTEAHRFTVA